MTFYQVYASFVISSSWEDDVLTGILAGTDEQLWECKVSDLKSPAGMDPLTFTNLLKQVLIFDTSSMNIHQSETYLDLDCNQTADGFTFTFASFKLVTTNRSSPISFYKQAILELVKDNINKTVNIFC